LIYAKTVAYDITDNDDSSFIYANASAYDSETVLKDIFTNNVLFGGTTAYYRPLLTVSFAICHKIAGTSPHFAHLTNVLLHILSCFIIFFFFKKYLMGNTAALAAALFFAVHPANIYTVSWIPGRNDSLFFILFLPALIFFVEYCRSKKSGFIILHFLFFMALLFTKESAPAAAVIFILYFITHKTKNQERLPAYIYFIWCLEILFFIFLQKRVIADSPIFSAICGSFNIQNISMFFEYYASMLFLTVPFGVNVSAKTFILGGFSIIFLGWLAFFCGKDKKKMFFYFIIPFIFLAPTMIASRIWYQGNRMYIPLFAVLAVLFMSFDRYKICKKYTFPVIIALLLTCSYISFTKSDKFKNGVNFWEAVYQDYKKPPVLTGNSYAYALLRFGYPDEAYPVIMQAMEEGKNSNSSTIYNLANYYFIKENYGEAVKYFEFAAQNSVLADKETFANLFICYKFLNNEKSAGLYYTKTAELSNNSYDETNKFISELAANLALTQKIYKERKEKNS
jgi:hypothetical protein